MTRYHDLLTRDWDRGREFALPGAFRHYPPDLELEPVHLDVDLAVDLEAQTCTGTVTTTAEARHQGPTRLELDAVSFEDLTVADTSGRPIRWTYDGRRLVVEWDLPFAAGERRDLAVTYRVVKPQAGMYFSQPSEAYPDDPWFVLTDSETERARYWLPCLDLPNARPRLDFHLRAASRHAILANGALLGEEDYGDGTKTAHWHLDYPCPSYLTCFAIGDFVRADDGQHQEAPIAYFAPRAFDPADLVRSFGRTGDMLAWMVRKLDMPFPFPKYFQVAVPGVGGAMENISLVTWDDAFVMDQTLAAELTRLVDEINVHEMAHSYFGDAVVCRDHAHSWLKESWATFMEQAWFEDHAGEDERQFQYYRDAQSYFDEADNRYKRPIVTRQYSSSWDLYDGHLYPGGACRIHTIRAELGNEVFWAAVRDYLKQYAGRVVETDDFRRVLEAHSGKSLVRQFEQWFLTSGYPAIKVTFSYDAKKCEGTFEVEQTQVKEAGKEDGQDKTADAAKPVPFLLCTDLGWTVDGEAHTTPVEIDQAHHTFIVPMPRDPEQVRFDPMHKVLHSLDFSPGDEKLRAQLVGAPDVIGRIQAASELAKTGTRANIQAVADAYRKERFWGARAWFARALGKAGVEAAVEALADLAAWETDPMVMEHLFRACGRYRDPRLRTALEARLDAGVPYYRATAAAYEALGAEREGAPFDRLVEASRREGFGGIAQAAALRALAMTGREEAAPVLLQRAAYGATGHRARPAAVAALGTLAPRLDKALRKRLVDTLMDLLRDPVRRVRQTAVAALRTAEAAEALAALAAFRAPLPLQEQVSVDRAAKAIRDAQEPKVPALEKQLSEVTEQVRKLRDQVEKLQAKFDAQGALAASSQAPGTEGGAGASAR